MKKKNTKDKHQAPVYRLAAYRIPAQRPWPVADRRHDSRRPMLPKQRQLQNSTLSIHTPVSIVSLLARPPSAEAPSPCAVALASRALDSCAGAGIMSGLTPSRNTEPTRPTVADSRKPGLERSISHHSSGLTMASVAEICSVDDQASLRYYIKTHG